MVYKVPTLSEKESEEKKQQQQQTIGNQENNAGIDKHMCE